MIRITIPPLEVWPEGTACSPECPFVCNDGGKGEGTFCHADLDRDRKEQFCSPGPDCPGPGEYVLVSTKQWRAVRWCLQELNATQNTDGGYYEKKQAEKVQAKILEALGEEATDGR